MSALFFYFMEHNKALTILIEAVTLAQSKGAFTLQESALVLEAVNTFKAPATPEEAPEAPEVVTAERVSEEPKAE